jgi:hypothetical protein
LYNLQHKGYDNNLVKYNFCKEIAGELHAQDKELPRTQHCRGMAGYWQGRGRGTVWERHGICESALTQETLLDKEFQFTVNTHLFNTSKIKGTTSCAQDMDRFVGRSLRLTFSNL